MASYRNFASDGLRESPWRLFQTQNSHRDNAQLSLLKLQSVAKPDIGLLETQDIALLETQDIALLETQDNALLETQDMALLESQDMALLESQDMALLDREHIASVTKTWLVLRVKT